MKECSPAAKATRGDLAAVRRKVILALVGSAVLACATAGGVGGYGVGYGGGLGYGGYGGGLGVGSSVVLLRGGPGFGKAVAGPSFLVNTVHHVRKVHPGGAIVAHSGLGGVGGGLGYGGYGLGGYGGYGLGYGGYGHKG
ncbi:uncharacterized protein LOC144145446 isoform X1 [Haemaphysalis longicornis]